MVNTFICVPVCGHKDVKSTQDYYIYTPVGLLLYGPTGFLLP